MLGRLDSWNVNAGQVKQFANSRANKIYMINQVERLRKEVKMRNFDVVLWYNLPMYVEMEYDEDLADQAGMD